MLRSERGQSLVELALVMFFVLIPLLMGIAALGPAFYSYIAITNGAREGARYGARHPNPSDEPAIQAIAVNEAMNSGTQLSNCNTPPPTVTYQNDWDGRSVRVSVRCDFTPILFGGPFPLGNAVVMKVEGP